MDNPNEPAVEIEPALKAVVDWIAENGIFPSLDQLRLLRAKGAPLPGPTKIAGARASKRWGGGLEGFKNLVRSYAASHREHPNFPTIVQALDLEITKAAEPITPDQDGELAKLLNDAGFIPPVVAGLSRLATIDAGPNPRQIDKEFERRVGHAFKVMGLDVEYLGGANEADGIVRTPNRRSDESWALAFDAKRWVGGFRMVKDEVRKLREYARTHGSQLETEGFSRRYLVLVAGSFREKDVTTANELKHDLGDAVQHVVFLEAAALVGLVEKRLSEGRNNFTDRDISRLFRTGILRARDIQ